jgi:hypothetical protein
MFMDNNKPMDALPEDNQATGQKKPYHTPKLQHFGGLAELVQLGPYRGADGEVRYLDCTSG